MLAGDLTTRLIKLVRLNAQFISTQHDAVELSRILKQRRIASTSHILKDRSYARLHGLRRSLSLTQPSDKLVKISLRKLVNKERHVMTVGLRSD